MFHQTVDGYPEGWLLATAAGLGFVLALLLVASVNSTKGRRGRRKQFRGQRQGLEDQVVTPEADHGRLLDAFFGPEEPSRHLGGPARPAELKSEDRDRRVQAHQPVVTSQAIQHPTEPLYQQVRSAHVREGREGRAEHNPRWATSERVEYPPEPLYEQARRALAWARTGTSQSRPAVCANHMGGPLRISPEPRFPDRW